MINCLVKTLSLNADKSGHYNKNREKNYKNLCYFIIMMVEFPSGKSQQVIYQ